MRENKRVIRRISIIGLWNDYWEYWIILFICALFCLGMAVFNQISIRNGLAFLIYQIGGIWVPGLAILFLFRWTALSRMEALALAYGIGYGWNIVLYYLTAPFGLQGALRYIVLITALAGCFVIVRNRDRWKAWERDGKGFGICCFFILLFLAIEAVAVCAANFYPPRVDDNIVYHDMLYWIGNTITLMRGYPAVSFRNYPQPYTYHFFSSMQLAVASLVTHIRPVVMGFGFAFLEPVFLMVLGGYALLRRLSGRYAFLCAGLAALFLVNGMGEWTSVFYPTSILATQFGFDVGLGLYLFFFLVLFMQFRQAKFDGRLCALSVCFLMLTVGAKAPFGVMALGAGGVVCIAWLLRKQYRKAFTYGILLLASFLLMYLFVVNLGSSDQPETSILQTFLNEPYIYEISDFFRSAYHIFLDRSGGNAILGLLYKAAEILLALLLSQYCIFIPMFYLMGLKLMKRMKWDGFDCACLAVIFVGAAITMIWGNPDSSIKYFIMTAYAPGVMLCVRTAGQLAGAGVFGCRLRRYAVSILTILLLASGIADGYLYSDKGGYSDGISYYLNKGFHKLRNERTDNPKDRAYITTDDYAAYEWVRCNTQEDALVAANAGLQRGREERSRHSRVPGVFTERYVISNEDTDSLFYDLDYGRVQALKEKGISYLIYNNTATPGFALPQELGSVVYSNATNVVYFLE